MVHRDTISEKSKFFEAATSSDRWREGSEKLIRLPEVRVAPFRAYIHWVYTGNIVAEIYWQVTIVNTAKEMQTYFDMYMLAESLDDGHLRTQAMDAMISKSVTWDSVPGPSMIEWIWTETPKASPLGTFTLGWIAACQATSSFAAAIEEIPKEFMQEMGVLLMKRIATCGVDESDVEFAARIRAELLPKPA